MPEFRVSLIKPEGIVDFKALAQSLLAINLAAKATRWGLAEFEALRYQDSLSLCVVEKDNEVIGFSVFSANAVEAYLVNIALSPNYQRQGIGKILLQFSLDIMVSMGAAECWLEVRESNSSAQSFYSKVGFAYVCRRKNFYQQPDEDAQSWSIKL